MKTFIAIFTVSILLFSCAYNKEELPIPESTPAPVFTGPAITYNNHTKKYFDAYCIACHSTGQTQAVFPLSTFNEVSVYTGPSGKIETRVIVLGNMPPSGSSSGFLTTTEKDTLQMWLDQGALQ